jgi:hypothetical protein
VTDPAETARLIEQDRQRREREWWLLLLFLFDEGGIDDVASHIRHDGDVGRVLNNVLGKAVVPLSRVSAAAHIGGMRRFANLTGQTFSPLDDAAKAAIARQYEATARRRLRRSLQSSRNRSRTCARSSRMKRRASWLNRRSTTQA